MPGCNITVRIFTLFMSLSLAESAGRQAGSNGAIDDVSIVIF